MAARLSAKQHAQELLDRLKKVDRGTSEAYYEMGRLLAALDFSSMYTELGYKSMRAMAEEELSFSPGVCQKYKETYLNFKRLKYNKGEALKLIQKYSYTNVRSVLPSMQHRIGDRAMARRIKEYNRRHKQLNFTVTEDEYEQMKEVLKKHGARSSPDHKQLRNSSVALLNALGIKTRKEAA